jgi:hypothetical protein
MSRDKPSSFFRRLVGLIVVGLAVLLGLALVRVGAAPEVTIEPELPGIGKKTPLRVTVREPGRGLSDVRVEIVQGDRVELLAGNRYTPRTFWKFWGDRTVEDVVTAEVGSSKQDWLREGPAKIRVTAGRASTWLRSPDPTVAEHELQVKLRPPSLQRLSTQTYVTQGGCEAVVYRVGPTSVRDGVQAGARWFPGHPLPGGGPQDRFALFAAPYDLETADGIRLVAFDDVGNGAQTAFVDRFQQRPVQRDTIQLTDAFLSRVVPEIMDHAPELRDRGNLLDNYLAINGELRQQNGETLAELARASASEFKWRRSFLQMRNAQVMSDFADRRTYVYDGRPVDRQDHLGFDLASVSNTEVQAANDGTVVLSQYFGIYGNTVVIDHGYGLMSLYGHLSSLDVAEGQAVVRGQVIGRSGQTGLAGGDHVHYTMLLQGLPVDPREWWDAHWLRDRLGLKLGSGLALADS